MAFLIDPIRDYIEDRWPDVTSKGVYNRRKIAGTNTWSQHAWANAWDIGPPKGEPYYNAPTLDDVARHMRDLRSRGVLVNGAQIGTILWRVRNHYDHIHIERAPKQRGTPPLNPPVTDYLGDSMLCESGDKGPVVQAWQECLLELGYELPEWGADASYGNETATATKKFQEDYNLPKTGAFDAKTYAALVVGTEKVGAGAHVHTVRIPGRTIKTSDPA